MSPATGLYLVNFGFFWASGDALCETAMRISVWYYTRRDAGLEPGARDVSNKDGITPSLPSMELLPTERPIDVRRP